MSDSLKDLEQAFQDMIDQFPEERRKMVTTAGEKLYQRVLRNIDSSTKEKTGNLRGACHLAIGSEGGYAAVRNNHLRAPHAHLVENGHRAMRGADVKEGKYGQPVKIKGSGKELGWVKGKHMYRNALTELEDELIQDAEKMIDKLAGEHF